MLASLVEADDLRKTQESHKTLDYSHSLAELVEECENPEISNEEIHKKAQRIYHRAYRSGLINLNSNLSCLNGTLESFESNDKRISEVSSVVLAVLTECVVNNTYDTHGFGVNFNNYTFTGELQRASQELGFEKLLGQKDGQILVELGLDAHPGVNRHNYSESQREAVREEFDDKYTEYAEARMHGVFAEVELNQPKSRTKPKSLVRKTAESIITGVAATGLLVGLQNIDGQQDSAPAKVQEIIAKDFLPANMRRPKLVDEKEKDND